MIFRKLSVEQIADRGTPYAMDDKVVALAMSNEYTEPILLKTWTLPAGAYGESCGST